LAPLGDYTLNIIELVSKVLDYFNKEKIVRIVCMFFDVSYFICNTRIEHQGKQGMSRPLVNDQCSALGHQTPEQTLG
jgi:hypothetical protein